MHLTEKKIFMSVIYIYKVIFSFYLYCTKNVLLFYEEVDTRLLLASSCKHRDLAVE